MPTTLTSKRHVVEGSLDDAIEFCFQQGWSDGLPVVPPTPPKVARMLEAARLDPKQQIAFVEHRAVSITAEKVAINAVMAGCKPEYMPVVVAAVEAIAEPSWSYHGPGTSTGGAGVLLIINGPIAGTLDVNSGDNLFGPGWRSNLTIGRALRLVMRNVCGSRPGTLDRGTLGHPGKLSLRHRRERGGEPVAAAPRRARLPARAEHGDGHGGRGAAPVLQPALEHGRRRAHHAGRRHADLRQRDGPAPVRDRPGRRAHAHGGRERLGQEGDSRVPVEAHAELARPSQAHP